MDRNDPNYDSGDEKRALAFHSRKVEQVKAYKQAVSSNRRPCQQLSSWLLLVDILQLPNEVMFLLPPKTGKNLSPLLSLGSVPRSAQ